MTGFIDDGVKSLSRYCLNNFTDGVKQDAVDLFTGSYLAANEGPPRGLGTYSATPVVALFGAALLLGGVARAAVHARQHGLSALSLAAPGSTDVVRHLPRHCCAGNSMPLSVIVR